jgi:hypothetical protein
MMAGGGRPTYTVVQAPSGVSLGDEAAWSTAAVAEITHWHAAGSDHRPRTQAQLMYSSDHIYVRFVVDDKFALVRHKESNEPVYTDSCAEFFFAPGTGKYSNIECNAIGAMLVGVGPEKTDGSKGGEIAPAQIGRVERWASAGDAPFGECAALRWSVAYALPIALVEELHGPLGNARPAPGVRWRGNLYKCADASSKPHWGQWSPIGEALNFHEPEFFGTIEFGGVGSRGR